MSLIDVTARYPIPYRWPREPMNPAMVEAIAIHHTAVIWLKPDATQEEELNHLDAIHRYHRDVRGFLGIGYHMVAFPSGRIYLVTRLAQWGAHVYERNHKLYGIAAAGLFHASVPGIPQLAAMRVGVQHIYDFLGRQVDIKPHLFYGGTTCPGARWQEWVPGLAPSQEDYMTPEQEALLKSVAENVTRIDLQLKEVAAKTRSNADAINSVNKRLKEHVTHPVDGGPTPEEFADQFSVEGRLVKK